MSLRRASTFAALTLFAAACSSEESTTPAPDPLKTVEGYCGALAAAVCNADVVGACYLSDASSLEADTTSCIAAMARPASCNPGGYDYDRAGAEACIAAARKTFADAKVTKEELAELGGACLVVFSKGGAQGTPCTSDTDCDGGEGLRCVGKPAASKTCQEPELVGPAGSCEADNQVCEPGLYCGADDACVKLKEVGQDCGEEKPCVDAALCTAGQCVAKKGNGEACSGDGECTGGFCVTASGASAGVCGSQLVLAPTTGDSCDSFVE